jgi:hypothetical protein
MAVGDPRPRLFFRKHLGTLSATATHNLFSVPPGMSLQIIAARLISATATAGVHNDTDYYTVVLHSKTANHDMNALATSSLVLASGQDLAADLPTTIVINSTHVWVATGETIQLVCTKVLSAANLVDCVIEVDAIPF